MPTSDDAVLQHWFPTPEARAGFDTAMREIKVNAVQGKYGTDPEEKSKNIQAVMRQAYPQLMYYEQGTPQAPSSEGHLPRAQQGPRFEDLRQFLAERGMVQQEKGFAENVGYPVTTGLVEGGLSAGGAVVGAGMGGPVGGMLGAGAGALASQAIDPALRYAFGMPQKSAGEMLTDTGISVGSNMLLDGLMSSANKFLGFLNRKSIFYGSNFTGPTANETGQLRALAEGSMVAGTYGTPQEAFPSPATFIEGSLGKRKGNLWTLVNDWANVSLFGSTIAGKRAVDFQLAKDALATDLVQDLARQGATKDPAQVATIIRDSTRNRFQTSREIRTAVYDTAGQLPGAQNLLDTSPLVDTFAENAKRLDFGQVVGQADRRFGFVENDLNTYLKRPTPLTPQNVQPGMPLTFAPPAGGSGTMYGGVSPGAQGTLHQINPNGSFDVTFPGPYGPSTFSYAPTDMGLFQTPENTATYKQLAELKSTLGSISRDSYARAKNAADPAALLVNARTAGYLQGQVNRLLDQAANQGQIPRKTLLAFQYADKLAAEEAETFANPIITRLVGQFKDEPEPFARELLKPDNADVLNAVHKATSSTPDILLPHLGTTEGELTQEIARPTLYRRVTNAQNQTIWESRIRPQIQKELIGDALEAQSVGNFEKALASPGVTPNPDDFVRFNPRKMIDKLEALTPNTRVAIFGNEPAYNRWMTAVSAMENYQIKQTAGIGSFLVVSKQSAALTQIAGSIGAAVGTSAYTGNPLLGLGLGTAILLGPGAFAKIINNPQTFKQFMYAVKQTPKNFQGSRIVAQLVQDSLREVYQESERRYPVMSGESR